MRLQTRLLVRHAPAEPEQLPAVLGALFSSEAREVGCHWVEALHVDPGETGEGPWSEAWTRLIVLMNERRDALRRHLAGGLVLVAPPQMKQRFREMATDLWSVRALVIELPQVEQPLAPQELLQGVLALVRKPSTSDIGSAMPDADFALSELQRLLPKKTESYRPIASMLMRAVQALLVSGRDSEALSTARHTWTLLRTRSQVDTRSRALVLHALALAEEAWGDFAAAADHLQQAVSLTAGEDDRQRFFLLADLARLAIRRGDLNEVRATYEEALALGRHRRQVVGDTPEALRDLSVSLNKVGEVRQARGQLEQAAAAYEESLALRRQLRQVVGDTPEALRDLSVSLDNVGKVRQARGQLEQAAAAYEESLALSRQLRQVVGDTPEALRDLSVSLNKVGQVRQARGQLEQAAAAYEESVALCRLGRSLLGDTPQSLQDLAYCLTHVANIRKALGDEQGAQAARTEAEELRRRLEQ
jgi:tetratricopeptide (TPR) repeat protein